MLMSPMEGVWSYDREGGGRDIPTMELSSPGRSLSIFLQVRGREGGRGGGSEEGGREGVGREGVGRE